MFFEFPSHPSYIEKKTMKAQKRKNGEYFFSLKEKMFMDEEQKNRKKRLFHEKLLKNNSWRN
jgi:hypothetical protein